MTHKRSIRDVLAFLVFTALFLCGCGALLITSTRAQESPTAKKSADGSKPENAEDSGDSGEEDGGEERPSVPPKDLKPRGPDELFTPLSEEGLYEGTIPAQTFKAVVLTVPNAGSPVDRPIESLGSNARYQAGGFMLALDQQLQYLPQIYTETNQERTRRYSVLLREGDAPRAGDGVKTGAHSKSLDAAADAFNAKLVFAVSFVPAEGEAPAKGAAFRYSKANGIERAVEWEFGKLAQPEPDSTVRMLEGKVNELCSGVGATIAEDGSVLEVAHAPIPQIASDDKALREFAKLNENLEKGEPAKAWIAYANLMKRDPRCGRAALYGMEVFRALASTQSVVEENMKYLSSAIEAGREGVKLAPNDVLLRGRLCWIAVSHFNRFDWAQTGIKQAMRVQPGNFQLMSWWLTCYEVEDREKQVQWLIDNVLPVIHDGRVELAIGNTWYGSGDYAKGIEWYEKGVKIAPLDHEMQMSLGLCANYEGERLARLRKKREATDAFATSSEALAVCQDIDPQAMKWVYEYYVRATTHKFKVLPTNPKTLERLFLTQACVNGLTSNRRTGDWDELVKGVIDIWRGLIRDLCRNAKPDEPMYQMKLLARLQFDLVEQDNDDLIHTLWLMREMGMRPEIYVNLMANYGPVVDEYQPKKDDDQG